MPAPTFSNLPAPSSSFAGPSRQPATMGSYATQAAGGAPWNQPRFNGNALFNNSNYGSQNRGEL
jgi:hypothetical protein